MNEQVASSPEDRELRTVLVTDCGSTTTKALLFERTDKGWRCSFRGESPTTVEAPIADVTIGVLNSFRELEELSSRKILISLESNLDSKGYPYLVTSTSQQSSSQEGIDLYLSTSSAGGGLQMVVMGLVESISTESAERAALGAGAIVMEAFSFDSALPEHEMIERLRHLKPDIVLLAGGIDDGAGPQIVELAELIRIAAPRPRFGSSFELPVIYAGNSALRTEIHEILSGMAKLAVVDNVRPELNREKIEAAREEIHELFLSHVMSHSPGYEKLITWTPKPIVPTPSAVGDMVRVYAERTGKEVLCVDMGGATTDVFSSFSDLKGNPCFNRTVSANYGMSYSIANVMLDSGVEKIRRWLPYEITTRTIRDRLRNKMIRPTSIPQTLEDLWLEQAVCREALRLSLDHHRSFANQISDFSDDNVIGQIFSQQSQRYQLVNMMSLDSVIGSGGVLSHAPNRAQAALMLLDGFQLEGITELTVDSIFMLPHLGVFAKVNQEAALEIFDRDCVIRLGYAVVPVYPKRYKKNLLARVFLDDEEVSPIKQGEITLVKFQGTPTLKVVPSHNSIKLDNRDGIVTQVLAESTVGLVLDGRNRPIQFSDDELHRISKQQEIFRAFDMEQ